MKKGMRVERDKAVKTRDGKRQLGKIEKKIGALGRHYEFDEALKGKNLIKRIGE